MDIESRIKASEQVKLDEHTRFTDIQENIIKVIFSRYDQRKGGTTKMIDWGGFFSGKNVSLIIKTNSAVDMTSPQQIVDRVCLFGNVLLQCVGPYEIKEAGHLDDLFEKQIHLQHSNSANADHTVEESALPCGTFFDADDMRQINDLALDLSNAWKNVEAMRADIAQLRRTLYNNIVDEFAAVLPGVTIVRDDDPLIDIYEFKTKNIEAPWKKIRVFLYDKDMKTPNQLKGPMLAFLQKLRPHIQSIMIPTDIIKLWHGEIVLGIIPRVGHVVRPVQSLVTKKAEASFMRRSGVHHKKESKHITGNLGVFMKVCEKVLADSTHPAYKLTRYLLRTAVEHPDKIGWSDALKQSKKKGCIYYGLIEYAFQRGYITCKKSIVKNRKHFAFSFQ